MTAYSPFRSVSFVLDGTVDTRVTVTEIVAADGTTSLKFDIEVLGSGDIGDMRALFFDLKNTTVMADSLRAEEYVGGSTPTTSAQQTWRARKRRSRRWVRTQTFAATS